MSEEKLVRTVVVTNPEGLHARPAQLFAKLASSFKSHIEVINAQRRVDGKSTLDVLTLVAMPGTELSIEACGEDAQAALDSLVRLVEANFSENGDLEH